TVSVPKRPCSTIWSSKPLSCVSTAVEAACWTSACLAIGSSILGPNFALEFVEVLRLSDGIEQQFLEFVVALQRAAQVRQASAQIEQFLQGLHLLRHIRRLEVFHLLQVQIYLQLRCIRFFAEFVFDRE